MVRARAGLLLLLSGCDLVLGLTEHFDAPPAFDAPIPRCAPEIPQWGLPEAVMPGTFGPPDPVLGPTVSHDILIYNFGLAGNLGLGYAVIESAAWSSRGYVSFEPPATGATTRGVLWRDASGLRLAFEMGPTRQQARQTSTAGHWARESFDLPARFATAHVGGFALEGTRMILETGAGIVEIDGQGNELMTTSLVNDLGGAQHPWISADGCWLMFDRVEGANSDLWISIRGFDDRFGTPVRMLGAPTPDRESWPAIGEDGALYYSNIPPVPSSDREKLVRRLRP